MSNGASGGGKRWVKTNPKHYTVAEMWLRDRRLRRKGIAKDGCCLFRAVADQVYLSQSTHWDLRRMCASYILEHPSRFKSFMTVPIKEYCWKLANCNLWGGEMELVALSELLERKITVYQEQSNSRVVYKTFHPKKSSRNPEVRLLFIGNNHYDAVWQSREEASTSLCQSILYELLIEKVTKNKMNSQDLSTALEMRGSDFGQPRSQVHPLVNKYPDDLLRGLATVSYFNVPYRVWKREKEAREKADRRLAMSMQFTIGDECQITYNGKQYHGDILSSITSDGLANVFVKELDKRVKIPINDIMLHPQHHHNGITSATNNNDVPAKGNSRGRHYLKSGGSKGGMGSNDVTGTPRKGYNKKTQQLGKQQQERHQRAHSYSEKEKTMSFKVDSTDPPSAATSATTTSTSLVSTSAVVSSYEKKSDSSKEELLEGGAVTTNDKQLQEADQQQQSSSNSSTTGFSDTTVRMASLMGRGNPLDILNQASLSSINEAPESEWPILHAGGGSGRGRLGCITAMVSNPQQCHLDGPPPAPPVNPPLVVDQEQLPLPFTIYSQEVISVLVQEMNPPLHLLKGGTSEGRQQFMYEFGQSALRFYSKYVQDPELEDALNDLLCMAYEEFISGPPQFTHGEFSVGTSVTSREGSPVDIREHSQSENSDGNTPRVSEEDQVLSDAQPESPINPKETQMTSSTNVVDSILTLVSSSGVQSVSHEKSEESSDEDSSPLLPQSHNDAGHISNGDIIQPDVPVNMGGGPPAPGGFQPPMMFPPGGHPPYGFPYPMMFPSPMIPWTYYPPPFMMPPIMPHQMRAPPILSSSSPTNEEGNHEDAQRSIDELLNSKTNEDHFLEETPNEGDKSIIKVTGSQEDGTGVDYDIEHPEQQQSKPQQQQEASSSAGGEGSGDGKNKMSSSNVNHRVKNNIRSRSFSRGYNNNRRQYHHQHYNYYNRGDYRRNNKYSSSSSTGSGGTTSAQHQTAADNATHKKPNNTTEQHQ